MPRRKSENSNPLSQFRLGESYTSLVLGIIVVTVVFILAIAFLKGKNLINLRQSGPQTSSTRTEDMSQESKATYTVVEGDTLWSISEKMYQSGYNWSDLASANKLENPDLIEVGIKLIIPKVEVKSVTPSLTPTMSITNSISGSSYIIQPGDDLWDIAIRAYGDGYAWVKIAQANNLSNPDLIHSGNTLVIPR